ncbi:MAG: 50S ribosomal protein L18 [Candidatus Kapabacteria bacterium]|nr:50S ribosomal protein L18 [Candidatus Kapabacteria bacterium]
MQLKSARHTRRKMSVRRKITGSTERPRLTIFRSAVHIYAQIIDDTRGVTLASASTVDKEVRGKITSEMTKSDESKIVGMVLAQRAKSSNVNTVAFDRNGFLYHGRVKALADGAREGGLEF